MLDIDTVRGHLAHWRDDAVAAGLAARCIAVAMATTAFDVSSRLVVVALVSSAQEAAERFRSQAGSAESNLVDAVHLQAQAAVDPIEVMYEGMIAMLRGRENTKYVQSSRGAIDATLDWLIDAVSVTEQSSSGGPAPPDSSDQRWKWCTRHPSTPRRLL